MTLGIWQWSVGFLAAFLVGLSKTGIAGLSALSIAIFATVLPSRESVGVVLVVLICADVVAVLSFRRLAVWSHLWRLFPWTILGVIVGSIALGMGNDQEIRRLIGVILLGLVVLQFLRRDKKKKTKAGVPGDGLETVLKKAPMHLAWVAVMGILAGFTTMVSNAAGPIMIMYLLATGLPKMEFMGTSAFYFFLMNLFKVPFSVYLGLIQPASLKVDIPLVPFALAGALLGRFIIRRINQAWFESLALGLTFLASLKLLFY